MQTYIVMMDENNEPEARSAAQFLNGQEFTDNETWSDQLDLVSDWLDYHHFSPNIAVKAVKASDYFARFIQCNNVLSNGICAAITVKSSHTEQSLDDLLHLLKGCVCPEEDFEVFVEAFTDKDLQWLYARNRDAVNCWLTDSRIDLFELCNTGDNIANVVTVLWAKAVLKDHFYLKSRKDLLGDRPAAL